uniref:NADP-dependent oxidoreductase domain-containing protein n=1 Tax=Parascaris equorum TaxID=6256 RepID=A0A914R6N3_PAREQ
MLSGQLKDLQTDYLDLYLIHVPCPCKGMNSFAISNINFSGSQFLRMFQAIGVSNFNEEQIQRILDNATVKPHNLQVETLCL